MAFYYCLNGTCRLNTQKIIMNHELLWLASYALDLTTSQLMARESFSPDEISKIDSLIERRKAHEPLQYIMGVADFYGRDFEVNPGVLIPRHDTETLIEATKKIFPTDSEIVFLDWGTGSGCVAITLLLEFPRSFAYMLDTSPAAIDCSEKNLARFDVRERAKIIREIDSSLELDLVISNPPYIPSREIKNLMPEVKDYEPVIALDGGVDGMDFYKKIFIQAQHVLKDGGYVIFESGDEKQVSMLKTLDEKFVFVNQVLDSGNFPRALTFKFTI